jgi:hypothetical protein
MGVGGQRHAPAALPPRTNRYPLYRRLGRPQGLSGRVPNLSSPPGFDPRTVQLVASRYTDWAIPALTLISIYCKFKNCGAERDISETDRRQCPEIICILSAVCPLFSYPCKKEPN